MLVRPAAGSSTQIKADASKLWVGTVRCAVRAAYQQRNRMPEDDRSARWYAGGDIAAETVSKLLHFY